MGAMVWSGQLGFHLASGLCLVVALTFWLAIDYYRVLRLRRKLPPGPLPLPLLGNWFDVPKTKPWVMFEELSARYQSSLVTLWTGRTPMVVCNDAWVMSELCEGRADIYSDRPDNIILGRLMGMSEYNQIIMPYGPKYKAHQRLTLSAVGPQASRSHRKLQSDESIILLRDILSGVDMDSAIERFSCSVVSIVGWGRRIDKMNDHVAVTTMGFMEAAYFCVPFLWILESIPILAILPSWLYRLPHTIRGQAKLFTQYFYTLALEGASSKTTNSFSKTLFKHKDDRGQQLTPDEIAGLTQNLLGCGVDATSSALLTFVLAMCTHQGVQAKAHAELDSVVGQHRLVNFEDEVSLPYTAALVTEVLRWRTVPTLAGFPHATSTEDIYESYHMPQGVSVTGNLYAIHKNPRDFPEPDAFRPERYLAAERKPYPNKKGHNAFGWGKRRCTGTAFAEQSLFIVISRLLSAFEIRPGLDDEGNEIYLDTSLEAYSDSENSRPKPFKARFIPRSKARETLIAREAERAREDLRQWDGETKAHLRPCGSC